MEEAVHRYLTARQLSGDASLQEVGAPSALRETDIDALHAALVHFIRNNMAHPQTGLAIWATAKLARPGDEPLFAAALRQGLEGDDSLLYQSIIALDNLRVLPHKVTSFSATEFETNRETARAYLAERPITYRLFYDKVFVGVALQERADLPNIHCMIELDDLAEAPSWQIVLERYRMACAAHHQYTLDLRSDKIDTLDQAIKKAAEPFGVHLWYVVHNDTGLSTKIDRPYFGASNYFRFSYASAAVDYDRGKLQARLQTRLMLMINSIASECESMDRARLKMHLDALGKLSGLLARSSAEGADLNYIVSRWCQEIMLLETTIASFKDSGVRRRIEQECARSGEAIAQ
jgi:hypothetical protein